MTSALFILALLLHAPSNGDLTSRRIAGEELNRRIGAGGFTPSAEAFAALVTAANNEDEVVQNFIQRGLNRVNPPGPPDNSFENKKAASMKVIVAALVPFAVIHFLLFLFYPAIRGNFYFALTAAMAILLGHAMAQGGLLVFSLALTLFAICAAWLVSSLYLDGPPRRFHVFFLCWLITAAAAVLAGISNFSPDAERRIIDASRLLNLALYPILSVEMFRILFRAISDKKDGAWIVLCGLCALFGSHLAYAALWITGSSLLREKLLMAQLFFLGVVAFALATSIYLARGFARTHQLLTERTKELALSNRRLDQARQSADTANKAKSLFLANMSHEIRTPMNAILGYAQILKRDSELSAKVRSAVETIEKCGDHLLAMINNILDLSKVEAGRMELQKTDFDLGSLIESLVAMFRVRCVEKGLNLKVEWDFPETPETACRFGEFETVAATHSADSRPLLPAIPLNGDEGKLRQVLLNLLGNALKFTDRGMIKLRISLFSSTEFSARPGGHKGAASTPERSHASESPPESEPAENIEPVGQTSGLPVSRPPASPAPEHPEDARTGRPEVCPTKGAITHTPTSTFSHIYRFEVIDTGAGLSHGAQLRLFEPFRQEAEGLRKGGTGLGLALSRLQVERMGGNLHVQSELGKGSKFYFDIPLAPAASSLEASTVSQTKEISRLARGHSVSALVVDDVRENRDVLVELLSGIGCDVRAAENAGQALDLLRRNMPQIVFMDIRMPGMWGDEALKRITSEFGERKPRVVALSASALAHERESYMKAGFDEFLSKPVRFELVCETLRRLLNAEFEYRETMAKDGREIRTPDPNRTKIPGYILVRLREAAERASATTFEKALQELEKIGAAEREIARFLRHRAEQDGLDAASEFLRRVKAR